MPKVIFVRRRRSSSPFAAGNQSAADVYTLLQTMAAGNDNMSSPSAGGTLTINSQSMGSYDYVIKNGSQTISSFSAADWFTATEDSRSAFIVVKGNLTIDAGQVFIPSVRKLFTAIYVTGTLTVTGGISMTARGANHSATGSNITAVAIRLATGTFSGVTNPQVPATGGATKAGITPGGAPNGNNGTDGGTGSGGAGGSSSSGTSGAGAAGSSFSGGPGGGAIRTGVTAGSGAANGGAGGAADAAGTSSKGGGSGNPGGAGQDGGATGGTGTGGVLFIVCGTLSGAGTIAANGVGTSAGGNTGGGSGGGSITVLYGTDSSSITPTATGGAAGTGSQATGGNGGDGTARKLALA